MTSAAPPIRSRYTDLSADQSASLLTSMLVAREPFFFVRYGDGALECMAGRSGMTCDREQYSLTLGAQLLMAWESLMMGTRIPGKSPQVYVGDWLSASFDQSSEHARYAEQYRALLTCNDPMFLHFEALLLMRESPQLVNFYKAVKEDSRKKLYMGPAENAGAAKMLGAEHMVTPMQNLHAHVERLTDVLLNSDFEILLYGAGMAGNIPAVKCWEDHMDRTYINLGSALDPLFGIGKSRRQQIPVERAKKLFKDLL